MIMRNKSRKRFLLPALLMFCAAVFIFSLNGRAAETCAAMEGSNVEAQDYSSINFANVVKSYLIPMADGGFMRVQSAKSVSGLSIEYYDGEYNLQSRKTVPQELALFGGFYAGPDAYYIVTGQTNTEENDNVEVFRITKYTTDWEKVDSASLYGENTTTPFASGSLRMDMYGKYLFIRTSHKMYTADDGKRHQANVTIQLDTETMQVTDKFTGVMNETHGYVSHSFNQFIRMDGNHIAAVDQGDAYPRALALILYKRDVSGGKFSPYSMDELCDVISIMGFRGATGENRTGATVGAFEISPSSYLVAGNSVIQDEDNINRKTKNVFVAAVDKETTEVTRHWLTDYAEGDGTTSTPQMVPLTDESYMVLWTRQGNLYYTKVNADGEKISEIYEKEGNLSDCVPVVKEGKLIWYTWKDDVVTFYEISLDNCDNLQKKEVRTGHNFQPVGEKNAENKLTLRCTICGEEKVIQLPEGFFVMYQQGNSYIYSSSHQDEYQKGDVQNWYLNFEGWPGNASDCNKEVIITSSDPNVVSVQETADGGQLIMKNGGQATVTFTSRWDSSVKRSYNIIVKAPDEPEVPTEPEAPTTEQKDPTTEQEVPTKPEDSATTEQKEPTKPEVPTTEQKAVPTSPAKEEPAREAAPALVPGVTETVGAVSYRVVSNKNEVLVTGTNEKKKGSVKIPNTVVIDGVPCAVTAIAPKAFAKQKNVTKVVVGNNVKRIGKNAFSGCSNLKSVTIGAKVKTIDKKAFANCKKLKIIKIKAKNLKFIGKNAFKGVPKRVKVKMPAKNAKKYKKLLRGALR